MAPARLYRPNFPTATQTPLPRSETWNTRNSLEKAFGLFYNGDNVTKEKQMGRVALFEGLIATKTGEPVAVTFIGQVPHYVVPDDDFMRHVESERIDRQVLQILHEQLEAHRELAIEAALKMIGKDDLFTKAMIEASINQMDRLLEQGIPEEMRAWLGLTGFKVIVNYRGDVVHVEQPGQIDLDE
jgi:hypothetical protein